METLTRKVVSLVTRHLDGGDSQFVALCDDGTMWIFRGTLAGTGKWSRITDIPQDDE